ncbi:citrate synthase family protein [Thalassospira sp. MCCC 1A01428]|uniref:citrate synthase family protein n=1 Tax=Thalassospira sp. MCCC 1A01428 TaxID=1470575 RepID=UPI000A1DE3D2|nr:citrate synthase family protein [Thalassospira sp. MCCC 1A01428]OSQ45595.1 excisionase [Thalassospira sp. MCCC 1A01428]
MKNQHPETSYFITAEEAADQLGVSRATLYAYVSRGLLRAHPTDGDSRRNRYARDDVTELAGKRRRGRKPVDIAKSTLDWGTPVLESAITLIRDGQLYYRSNNAVDLSERATLEDVASLLWDLPRSAEAEIQPLVLPDGWHQLKTHYAKIPVIEALLPLFAITSEDGETGIWQRDEARLATGAATLLGALFACVTGRSPDHHPLHVQLATAWGLDAVGADLVRQALVLCADHELNASSFTARCVASTQASLRMAIIGGLAALSGGRHGGMTERIETAWLAIDPHNMALHMRRQLAAGVEFPGFGHPLYPAGDVRANALLAAILPQFDFANEIVETMGTLTGKAPSIDFALVAMRRYLGLPEGAAFCVFALGRSVGWIAHALEQRRQGQLIRPRAVYVGPDPVAS